MPCTQTGSIERKKRKTKGINKDQSRDSHVISGLMDTSNFSQVEVVDADDRELFNTLQTDDSPLSNVVQDDAYAYERSPT
jgi:hypothetical protein